MGAVIDEASFNRLSAVLKNLTNDSEIEILAGGKADNTTGYFVEPTLVISKNPKNKVFSDEYFGPILAIHVFPDNQFDSILEIFHQKKNLEILYYCNADRSIKRLQYFTKLQILTFSSFFNKPIDSLQNLIQLRSLTFGSDFNQPINVLERLTNLKSLTFGWHFNQPINVLEKLTNLQSLKIIFFFEKYDF
jgi:hypothetical protein